MLTQTYKHDPSIKTLMKQAFTNNTNYFDWESLHSIFVF